MAKQTKNSPKTEPATALQRNKKGGGKSAAVPEATQSDRKAPDRNPRKPVAAEAPAARTGTKQAKLIELLRRKGGAAIPELAKTLGWQPHTVRGAISGALKKKLGLAVSSAKAANGERVYRIG